MTPPSIIGFVFVFVKKRGKEGVELDLQWVLGGWEWEIRGWPARPSQNPDPSYRHIVIIPLSYHHHIVIVPLSYHHNIVIIPPSYHNELGRNKGMCGVENGKLCTGGEVFVEWEELVIPTDYSEYSALDSVDGKLWWERSTWNGKRENQMVLPTYQSWS